MAKKDIDIKITIEDNSDIVIDEMNRDVERALYASGVLIQEGATRAISGQYGEEYHAVDTGRLRASISFITPEHTENTLPNDAPQQSSVNDLLSGKADKNSVIFGSNVEYASFVENGTERGMTKRPFLRKGVDIKTPEIEKKVQSIFKGEL